MKKIVSLFMISIMLFAFTACKSNTVPDDSEISGIMASYSVKNSTSKGKFIVEVQNLGGVYEKLYDENGIVVKFVSGEDEIYDSNGNKITRDDLDYGDTVEIQYDGKLAKENPKTIRAYKVIKVV